MAKGDGTQGGIDPQVVQNLGNFMDKTYPIAAPIQGQPGGNVGTSVPGISRSGGSVAPSNPVPGPGNPNPYGLIPSSQTNYTLIDPVTHRTYESTNPNSPPPSSTAPPPVAPTNGGPISPYPGAPPPTIRNGYTPPGARTITQPTGGQNIWGTPYMGRPGPTGRAVNPDIPNPNPMMTGVMYQPAGMVANVGAQAGRQSVNPLGGPVLGMHGETAPAQTYTPGNTPLNQPNRHVNPATIMPSSPPVQPPITNAGAPPINTTGPSNANPPYDVNNPPGGAPGGAPIQRTVADATRARRR